jgi:DNA-binding response OmpR family regulator
LLLADVGLPRLNGRQLADATRLRRPNLPVLLITGSSENPEACGNPNGMDVMGMPFTIDVLTKQVQAMLGHPASGREKVRSTP